MSHQIRLADNTGRLQAQRLEVLVRCFLGVVEVSDSMDRCAHAQEDADQDV